MELELYNMELEYKIWNWNFIILILKYRKTAILYPKNSLKTK